MPCYHPIPAWRSRYINKNGKRELVFNRTEGFNDKQIFIPCSKCIGCKMERALQMTIRCQHEALMYDDNTFITLTYSNDHPEKLWSLNKRDFQLFMKRLRKKYKNKRISYYMCGEYGEDNERPHYHAILFNHIFDDEIIDGENKTSETLKWLWTNEDGIPYGQHAIGDVTFESINYVASHMIKIITGQQAQEHYGSRIKEFSLSSRNPAIGKKYYDQYKTDLYNNDECVIRDGLIHKPPRYYDKKKEEETLTPVEQIFGPDKLISLEMEVIRQKRTREAVQRAVDVDRRYAKEVYKQKKLFNKKMNRKSKNV